MTRFFIPIIFLIISIGLFFGYIDPTYKGMSSLMKDEKLFNNALDNSKKLQEIRDELLAKYNSFNADDLKKLEKMLPKYVDNVRLIRDIDGISSKYGMKLKNVSINTETQGEIGSNESIIGTVVIGFSVTGPYKVFLSFLGDLEKSMRIIDITEISFTSSEKDLYEYKISLKTYWLK